MLCWTHVGDLHASDEDEWDSLRLLSRIAQEIDGNMGRATDFAFLPGDNANNGEPSQYRRIREALEGFGRPWFAIPGDHDFEPKSLANFYAGLNAQNLPLSVSIKGHRCIFLDIVSSGSGGPDFRLGAVQTDWLKDQLSQSESDPERPVVFMHAFPGDLAEGGEALAKLFAEHQVASIDTGHTHYNELLNDGEAIYSATRSTGQIEEGPPGFSVHAIDGSVASWRFKPLDSPWPFVLITSPADRRLIVDRALDDQSPKGPFAVHAKAFGEDIEQVTLSIDDQPTIVMSAVAGALGLWAATVGRLEDGRHSLVVSATALTGATDRDRIEVEVMSPGPSTGGTLKPRPGDHVHTLGAWPERGLLGSQLGPNKNGTIKW